MPPITTMAKGRWLCAPMRVEKAAGTRPKIAVSVGHHHGPQPMQLIRP